MLYFSGLHTALITPFRNNSLDTVALNKIILNQINNNIKTLVIAGSTGEGNNLTLIEYELLLKTAMQFSDNKINIVAGCSDMNYHLSIQKAKIAEEIGVYGLICSIPPYSKPTQPGIYEHFFQLHEATRTPIMLYSIPSRVGVDFTLETIIKLSKLERILGLKDASSDLYRTSVLKKILKSNFALLGGDDASWLSYVAMGGDGLVSVASNVLPKQMREIEEIIDNDFFTSRSLQMQLNDLYEILSLEVNPVCVKYILYLMKFCENEIKPPLTLPKDDTKQKILYWLNGINKM